MADTKRIASMMGKPASPGVDDSAPEMDPVGDVRHYASKDVMAALDSKSHERLTQALANFIDLHHAKNEMPK